MTILLQRFALLVVLAGNAGCAPEDKADTPNHSISGMRADSGIELRVFLPRDTIRVEESSPIEVHYLIVNGPKATRFSNAPERFAHRIVRADGQAVLPKKGGAPVTGSYGRQVLLVLPANAWLGQSSNLRCLAHGGGYGVSSPVNRDCLAEYDLQEPGTYRVIVEYATPEVWPNLDSIAAVDTSKLLEPVRPLVPSRRLADTATLVVQPE